MTKFPDKGLYYEQAKKTCLRHAQEGSTQLVNSMINQVYLAEGKRAAEEFSKEIISKANEYRKRKL